MRGILAGEEHDVLAALVARLVHLVRRHVDHLARPRPVPFAVELDLEVALEDEDPLLVWMRMRARGLAGRVAHQRDDHALAFDAAAEGRRVVGTAHDPVDAVQVEYVLAGAGALRAGRERFSHCRPAPRSRSPRSGRWLPARTRWRSSRPAEPDRGRARPPRRRRPRGWRAPPWPAGSPGSAFPRLSSEWSASSPAAPPGAPCRAPRPSP